MLFVANLCTFLAYHLQTKKRGGVQKMTNMRYVCASQFANNLSLQMFSRWFFSFSLHSSSSIWLPLLHLCGHLSILISLVVLIWMLTITLAKADARPHCSCKSCLILSCCQMVLEACSWTHIAEFKIGCFVAEQLLLQFCPPLLWHFQGSSSWIISPGESSCVSSSAWPPAFTVL